jgi:hypothetical protein
VSGVAFGRFLCDGSKSTTSISSDTDGICTDARQGTLAAGHYSRGNQMLVLELEYQCLELHLVDFSVMDQRALLVFQAILMASFRKSMTGAVLWS